jgi:hypothetical protein
MTGRAVLCVLLVASGLVGVAEADAGAPTVTFTYPNRSKVIRPNEKLAQTVPCPRGSQVVGGGSLVTGSAGESLLHVSAPFDGDDRDKDPDDGWRTVGTNRNDTKHFLSSWAICAVGANVSYLSALVELPPGGQPQATQPCATGERPTGGGVAIKRPNRSSIIQTTFPIDNADADAFRNNGWGARLSNGSERSMQFRLWAICTTSGTLSVQGNPAVMDDGETESIFMSCPGGYSVTGGGFFADLDDEFILSGNHPSAASPDETWIATATNRSGSTENVSVWALCMTS